MCTGHCGLRARLKRVHLAVYCVHARSLTGTQHASCRTVPHRLVGLVVKASASRAEDPGFESRWRRDFSGVESYQ